MEGSAMLTVAPNRFSSCQKRFYCSQNRKLCPTKDAPGERTLNKKYLAFQQFMVQKRSGGFTVTLQLCRGITCVLFHRFSCSKCVGKENALCVLGNLDRNCGHVHAFATWRKGMDGTKLYTERKRRVIRVPSCPVICMNTHMRVASPSQQMIEKRFSHRKLRFDGRNVAK